MTNADKHRCALDLMHSTYTIKNAAYGDSFTRSLDRYGPIAALVRIEDKINRLHNLIVSGGAENDESVFDTLLDAANYLTMAYMWLSDKQAKRKAASQD